MDKRSAMADNAGVALWFDHLPSDPNRVSVSGESYESSDHMAKAPFQEASHLDSITLYVAFQSLFPTEELDKLRRLLADFLDQAGDDFPPWRMMWPGSSE